MLKRLEIYCRPSWPAAAQRVTMSESREQFVDHAFEEPRDEVEQSVARIIAEVLDVDRAGRMDSFYDFGGTSLEAIRICARVESELGFQAQPTWLFTSDVVADFASKLRSEHALAASTDG
jgi:acyl carrier protein